MRSPFIHRPFFASLLTAVAAVSTACQFAQAAGTVPDEVFVRFGQARGLQRVYQDTK